VLALSHFALRASRASIEPEAILRLRGLCRAPHKPGKPAIASTPSKGMGTSAVQSTCESSCTPQPMGAEECSRLRSVEESEVRPMFELGGGP
jgi:hypothetical protein